MTYLAALDLVPFLIPERCSRFGSKKGPQESQEGMKQNSLLFLLTPQHTIIILVLLFLFPSCRRSTTAASDRRHHEEERRYLPLFVSKDALDCPLFLF